jgi:hypothetical protein
MPSGKVYLTPAKVDKHRSFSIQPKIPSKLLNAAVTLN